MGDSNGRDRDQIWLFPEVGDDDMDAAHPVRVMDVSVDGLNLAALGFQYATPTDTGRPPYPPGDRLKLDIDG
jgi:hypothetical protein